MITASHNPKEYNGMKCLAHSGEPYNLKKYGPDIVKIMEDFYPLEKGGQGGLGHQEGQSSVTS